MSVYDLKDHPDFQYRPGTLVIRIANFEGEDAKCTAGQVLDNYPEGQVKVWWVDGHISMCWPQDLYKVSEYDSDEGELWDDVSSDSSWETELEDCFIADNDGVEQTELENIKPKLAAHIEKARIAMSRLEEIFTQNPSLQTTEVMRKLLEVYKDCRYMDKLMGTSFFHECHFQGLLERVRERGRANVAQRMADQVTRLFTPKSECPEKTIDKDSVNISSNSDHQYAISVAEKQDDTTNIENNIPKQTSEEPVNQLFIQPNPNPEDSGLYSAENSKKESGSSESSGEFLMSEDVNNAPECSSTMNCTLSPEKEETTKIRKVPTSLTTSRNVAPTLVCVKLCNLIKAQLVLAHAEVSKRFGLGKMSLSEAEKTSPSPQKKPKSEKERPDTIDPSESSIDIPPLVYADGEGFSIEETAPDNHKFKLTMFQPTDPTNFFRTVSKELKLLKSSLPPGVWVKGFEDRIDLYSVMFRGPEKTPYEDGLFLFDFQLSADYPAAPPLCHYISYCSDRLNPNLYEDGKVCVSLLGTWSGRGTEVWTSSSTLLQVIVSIQGLILVSEPYFNEAGFEKQKGSQQGRENSRMYNEMVMLKLVQAQTKLLQHPPPVFQDIIITHFKKHAEKLLKRLELWMEISEQHNNQHPLSPVTPTTFKQIANIGMTFFTNFSYIIFQEFNNFSFILHTDEKVLPEFPLIPASRGFCITLRKTLATFKEVLIKENIIQKPNESQNNENATDLRNNVANNCREETSKSAYSKPADCNESSNQTTQANNNKKKPQESSNDNQSIKEETLPSATNSYTIAPSETKKSTTSQNTS